MMNDPLELNLKKQVEHGCIFVQWCSDICLVVAVDFEDDIVISYIFYASQLVNKHLIDNGYNIYVYFH